MALDVHYEILGYNGSRWAVLDVSPDQDLAINMGRATWRTGRHKAIRVVRERFDREQGVFNTMQVFYEGQKVEARKIAPGAIEDERPASCWKLGDLYNYEGRRTIAGLLARRLEEWRITPTELLHHPEHYRRLDDNGTELQNAVQKIAIGQIQGTGQPVQERMREIFAIIDQAVTRLNALWSRGMPKLDPEDIEPTIKALEADDDRGFTFAASLAQHFKDYPDLPTKFEHCLDLLAPERPKWFHRVIDGMVGELLTMKAVLPVLLARFTGEFAEIKALAALRLGRVERPEVAEPIDKLNALIRVGRLEDSMTSLDRLLIHRIVRARQLADGSLVGELQAVAEIAKFCDDDQTEFCELLEAALAGRCEKLLIQYRITEYIAGSDDPLDWLDKLSRLEPLVVGSANKKALANFILPILMAPEREPQLVVIDRNVLSRMKGLAGVQRLVLASHFDFAAKDKMEHRYDQLSFKMLSGSALLERIDNTGGEAWQKALKLLHFAAEGTFSEGETAKLVRQKIRDYMRGGDFLERCLATCANASDQAAELKKLMELMTAAGLSAS